ncbi:MAG: FAD-dependent oxidoreductase [Saprospiraceae bacterium]|nr:FAD-dependent oxidoreductase [Saprospiraceae bacterium]
MNHPQRIYILGAGLSGLTLAYLLAKKDLQATILEASPRIGGRIQTIQGPNGTPLELGATWFSDMHPNLIALLNELGLKKFPQFSKGKSLFQTKSFEPPQEFHVPEAQQPSYRIEGGTQRLTDTLASKVGHENILTNCKVTAITDTGDELQISSANGASFQADKVIVCMPPQLAGHTIQYTPTLPDNLTNLLPNVQTWMAGSIKFILEYKYPFWREKGYSGMLYSHAGIVTEMYDHTDYWETHFALAGFLNGGAAAYTKEVRKEFVIAQLAEMLDPEVSQHIWYEDKVWNDDHIISGHQRIVRPHQNNGHPLLQNAYMNGKLHFSATESSTQFPGYMEGAVISAMEVVRKIGDWGSEIGDRR